MTDHDLQHIAFVTRRFHELQGLKPVALGTGLLFGVVLWSCAPEGLPRNLTYFLHQGTVWGFLLGISVVDRHYRAEFGAVVNQSTMGRGAMARPWLPLYLAVFAEFWVSNPLLYGDPPAAMPNLAAVALTVTAVWILLRDGVLRAHYAIAAAVGTAILLVGLPPSSWTGPFSPDPARDHVLAFGYALVGVALIAVGLLDHHQLRLALTVRPGLQEGGGEPVTRPSPSGGPARMTAGVLLFISAGGYSLAGWDHPSALSVVLSAACLSVLGVHYSAAVLDVKAAHRQGHWRFPAVPKSGRRAPPDIVSDVLLPLTVAAGVVLDMLARGAGVPSLAALAFCCWRLWLTRRDGRRGLHHLAGAVAGLVAAVAYRRVSTPAEALAWLTFALGLLGLTLMIEGGVNWYRQKAARPGFGESRT